MFIEAFIDSIERLDEDNKQQLKDWITNNKFGASLTQPCDDFFKDVLSDNLLPFNSFHLKAIKQAIGRPGTLTTFAAPFLEDQRLAIAAIGGRIAIELQVLRRWCCLPADLPLKYSLSSVLGRVAAMMVDLRAWLGWHCFMRQITAVETVVVHLSSAMIWLEEPCCGLLALICLLLASLPE